MPKFAANLSMLFGEVDFLERFNFAAETGFKYIEYLFPYEYEPELLALKLSQNGLQQVLFNLPPGDWDAGERGIACLPDRIDEFRAGVAQAIEYAGILGVEQVNCLAGIPPIGLEPSIAKATLLKNVIYAADQLANHNMDLLIESINSRVDMPGFFLDTSAKALELIDSAERANLKFQFDIYHMQIMEGDLLRNIERLLPFIGHIQFADNPGRHEPGTGEINLPQIFRKLDLLGYDGWVSAEYIPSENTKNTLGWLQSFN